MDYTQLRIQDYQTTYNIIENSQEDGYLKLYLEFVKTYLSDKSLWFSAGEAGTIQRYAVNTRQTYFNIPFVKKINLQKVSYFNNNIEEVLTYLTDYTLEHKKGEYLSILKLLNKDRVFYTENYLQIEGTFGFEEIPNDLHFIFLEMFADLLNNYKLNLSKLENDGQDVSSLRAGNITYNFTNQSSNSMNFSQIFVNNTNLKQILNGYF